MANVEHVAKLKEGVQAWNAWWYQNWSVRVLHKMNLEGADFEGANLKGMDLVGAHLYKADLREADLSRANLARAYLFGADFTKASLGGANFAEADLDRANFTGADFVGASFDRARLGRADLSGVDLARVNLARASLIRADLSGASLVGANLVRASLIKADLSGASLVGVDLTHAVLWWTIFANVDLTDAKGLESCIHKGPSTIDHHTLTRSNKLPLSFLRGCGLPDTFIDYLPSLLNQPIQFYSCFISYSSKDEAFAQRLHADLQDKGVRCWFAPEDMKIGAKFRVRIDEAIRTYEKLLLLLSAHSVASTWVEKEVETAFDKENERKELVLFPIRLDDAVMKSKTGWAADIRRSRHIGDFCNWKNHDDYQKGLERLLRDLKIGKDK